MSSIVKAQIDLLTKTRKNVLEEIKDCSIEQLNEIPNGFNNNIIWNVAHLIATMDILVYKRSGTSPSVSDDYVDAFKKGSFPQGDLDEETIVQTKDQLLQTLLKLEEDYEKGVFGEYEERTTSYGVTLSTVEEAITFCNLHESMHYGQIKMMRKLLG